MTDFVDKKTKNKTYRNTADGKSYTAEEIIKIDPDAIFIDYIGDYPDNLISLADYRNKKQANNNPFNLSERLEDIRNDSVRMDEYKKELLDYIESERNKKWTMKRMKIESWIKK